MTNFATDLDGGVFAVDAMIDEEVPVKPTPKTDTKATVECTQEEDEAFDALNKVSCRKDRPKISKLSFTPTDAYDEVIFCDTIAAIDLESLDLKQNCVVYEIGVVFTNFLPVPTRLWRPSDLQTLCVKAKDAGRVFNAYTFKLSIMEQVLNGRTMSQDTLEFHKKAMPKRGIDVRDYFTDHEREAERLVNARKLLTQAFDLHKPTEVWCNHTSFDMPRISGALFNGEANALPWHFRTELDIATAKLMFRKERNIKRGDTDPLHFPEPEVEERHDSIADCLYNLSALSVCLNYRNL